MGGMKARFVTNQPALVLGKALVIADLHLGIEYDLARSGVRLPAQGQRIYGRVKKLLEETGKKELIVLGDFKHTIAGMRWPENVEIPRFVEQLKRICTPTIVAGNHDGGLSEYVKGVEIIQPQGFEYSGHWLFHGHALPPKEAFSLDMIISHMHPMVEFKDSLGGRMTERVWVRGRVGERDIIMVPAFNDLLGGVSIAAGIQGPLAKLLDWEDFDVYLLDGMHLGTVGECAK